MSMEDLQRATMAQRGLAQFEKLHQPVQVAEKSESGQDIVCLQCEEDWPCERMSIVLISQSISMLAKMIPSGNMSQLLSRFSQSQQ
jgi:hypothetical protein